MPKPEIILQRLEWTIIRRLDGLLQGNYRTLFQGFGLDLSEPREYQYSDDVRYIDWNVTARLQVPYVRQYLEDREVTAWFLLDLSPSIDFGTVKTLKRSLLIDFAALLSRLLTRHGNRVGAILFSGRVERIIPPGGGKLQVLRLIKSILDQPPLKNSPQTDLSVLLENANRLIQRRSLVFLISDFISVAGWEKPLKLLSRRHEMLAVRLLDKREMELPDIGGVFLEDAETREQLFIDTHDAAFRRRFARAAEERRYLLLATLRLEGIDLLELSTEGDMVNEVLGFVQTRKKRRLTPAQSDKGKGAFSNPKHNLALKHPSKAG